MTIKISKSVISTLVSHTWSGFYFLGDGMAKKPFGICKIGQSLLDIGMVCIQFINASVLCNHLNFGVFWQKKKYTFISYFAKHDLMEINLKNI